MARFRPGIDLVDVRKLARIFRDRAGLVEAVFTERETNECLQQREPWSHFAAHFAAKEAFLKALGLGFDSMGSTRAVRELEVVCAGERPHMVVHGWLAGLSRKMGISDWSVSLGEACGVVAATVIAVQRSDAADRFRLRAQQR